MFGENSKEQGPSEWITNIKENSAIFSREGEFVQKLEEAINKDFEMHEVYFFKSFINQSDCIIRRKA